MTRRHLETYSWRTIFLEMLLGQRGNFVPALVRNEPECQFSECFATNHRLGASTLIAAAETVDLRRRSRPNSLKGGKAFFAK